MRTALRGDRRSLDATGVADVRTTVMAGVSIEDFGIEAGSGDAYAIVSANDGSGVEDGDDEVFGIFAAADERENAAIGVIAINPFESVPIEIDLVKSGFAREQPVEIGDQMLNATVKIILKEMPLETDGLAPLGALAEFLAHEKKFLSWVSVLIGIEKAEIGELLPHVAGHFVEERMFSVDDLVMGKRQHEIFTEGVNEREGNFVVFEFAIDGI